ncbi:MFS transporter [Halorussus limi]|uniref:MFS transporter n=1 Tax=Halorussus limi TaxID=2938695 RepID=A0A8U0HX47_9EURY|nr:MFS transporter [Halorussus limi]UPV75488.1 MFS transporter [Halorussus limi]
MSDRARWPPSLASDRLPPSPVLKYYCYQATVSFGFFSPIFTLFLLDRGLDYTAIASLSVLYAVLTVGGEIPTGYVGDRLGRRASLLLSSAFMTLSILGFALVRSYVGLAVLYVLWTLSLVFRSGTGDAWLYDALAAGRASEASGTSESRSDGGLDADRFAHVRGRGQSVNKAVTVVTMLAGGVLYSVRPTLPFVASAVLNGAGVVVLLTLPKNRQYLDGDSDAGGDGAGGATDDERLGTLAALAVLREQLTRPRLRWFVAYAALFFGVVAAADTYVQPISTETLGVPVASMGLLYAAFAGVSAVASYYAGAVQDRLGVRGAVLAIPLVLGVALVAPLLWPLLALPTFFVMKGSRSLLYPIVTQRVNDEVASVGRATVLSAASMAYALVKLPLYLLGGAVADATSALVAFGVLGGVFLAGIAAVRTFASPVGESEAGDGK